MTHHKAGKFALAVIIFLIKHIYIFLSIWPFIRFTRNIFVHWFIYDVLSHLNRTCRNVILISDSFGTWLEQSFQANRRPSFPGSTQFQIGMRVGALFQIHTDKTETG